MRLPTAIVVVVAAATTACAQLSSSYNPESVLERTRERLLADLSHLPRYTCVQTVIRRYYRRPSASPGSCSEIVTEHEKRKHELPLRSWDRLRLEVAIVNGQDIYSWVGGNFKEDNLEDLAGRGPLGSGDFGTFLNGILRGATISFRQEKVLESRTLLEYSYDVPLANSAYSVRTSTGWTPTSYSGTLLLDPEAADVVDLIVRTAELPETNPSCQYVTDIEYGRIGIHDRMILVPHKTRLNTIDRGGAETLSLTTYDKCREYASQVRILPQAVSRDATMTPMPAQPAPTPDPVSSDLLFSARIVTPIDSDTAAAGDAIEAVLRSTINDKKKGLHIPAGARIHGRLMNFNKQNDFFWFAVQMESIEVNGRAVPFSAAPHSFSAVQVFVPQDSSTFVSRMEHLQLDHLDWRWTTTAYDKGQRNRSLHKIMALEREVEIANGEYPIDATSAAYFHFSVPSGATNVQLQGSFNVLGPPASSLEITPKDVEVFLVTKKEFENWQANNPTTFLYSAGRVKSGDLDISLPPDAETYYLVFNNDAFKKNQNSSFRNDPLNPKRQLKAVLLLRYNF